jgi:hypothetical protein
MAATGYYLIPNTHYEDAIHMHISMHISYITAAAAHKQHRQLSLTFTSGIGIGEL